MTPLRQWLEVAHITAAGLWTGAVAMTGAAAAIIFPTIKSLDPTLPGYPDYTGEHWRLAAGFVAARVFAVSDIVQFICVIVTGASLIIIAASASAWQTRIATLIRLTAFGAALMLIAYSFFVLGPRMNRNLSDYWAAAEAGDNAAAAASQAAFMLDHAPATRTMAGTVLATLLLTGSGVASLVVAPRTTPQHHTSQAPHNTSDLETPSLLKTNRS